MDENKFEKVGVIAPGCKSGQHSMDTSKPKMSMNGDQVVISFTCFDCGIEISRAMPGFPVGETDKQAMRVSSGEQQPAPSQGVPHTQQSQQPVQEAQRTELPKMPFGAPPWARMVMDRYDNEKPNDDFWADVKDKIRG